MATKDNDPKFTSNVGVDPDTGQRFTVIDGERIDIISQEQVQEARRAAVQTGTREQDGVRITVTENEDGTYRVEREFESGGRGIIERADTSSVLALQGVDRVEVTRADPSRRTVTQLERETLSRGEIEAALADRRPGETQTAALLRNEPGVADALQRQQIELRQRLERYRVGEGIDLAAAVESSDFTDEELGRLFSARELSEARDFINRRDLEQNQVQEQAADAQQRRDETARRIDDAGGLVASLYSDNPNERITRQQAIDFGFTEEQLDQAIAEERQYVEARGEYESAVRDQAQRQSSAARAPDPATSPSAAAAPDDRERQAVLDRLRAYPAVDGQGNVVQGQYRASLALAAGDVGEDDLRRVFAAEDIPAVVNEARQIRQAAANGYYASGAMVPESLRRALLLRSADLSAELQRQQAISPRYRIQARSENLRRDIQDIDRFLQEGGLLPDMQVNVVAEDVQRTRTALEGLRAQRDSTRNPAQLRQLEAAIRLTESRLAQREADLTAAVSRAETDPALNLRTTPPLEEVIEFARRAPSEAAGIAIRETAVAVLSGGLISLGARAATTAARATLTKPGGEIIEFPVRTPASTFSGFRPRGGVVPVVDGSSARLIAAEDLFVTAAPNNLLQFPSTHALQTFYAGLTPAQQSVLAGLSGAGLARAIDAAAVERGLVETAPAVSPSEPDVLPDDETYPDVAPYDPATSPYDPFGAPSEDEPDAMPFEPDNPFFEPDEDPLTAPAFPEQPSPADPTPSSPSEPSAPVIVPFVDPAVPTPTPDELPSVEPESPAQPSELPAESPTEFPAEDPEAVPAEQPAEIPALDPASDPGITEEPARAPVEPPGTAPATGTPADPSVGLTESPSTGGQPEPSPSEHPGRGGFLQPQPTGVPGDRTQPGIDPTTDPDPGPGGGPGMDFTPLPDLGQPRPRRNTPRPLPRKAPGKRSGAKTGKAKKLKPYPGIVGHKQGPFYRYKDLQNGGELHTRRPVFGQVPNIKGKGSAKKSARVITTSDKPPKHTVDQMGVVDAVYGGKDTVSFRGGKKRKKGKVIGPTKPAKSKNKKKQPKKKGKR